MSRKNTQAARPLATHRVKPSLYICTVIALGTIAIYFAARAWNCPDTLEFAVYLSLSLAGSVMKVALPGVDGTMSVNFFFVFLGLLDLAPSETLLIGCVCVVVQYLWKCKTAPKLQQLAFNVATVAIAIWGSSNLYHLPVLKTIGLQFPLRLALTSCGYFLLNTFPVAMIISLSGEKRFPQVWRECYVWSFPYYVMGAVLTGLLHIITVKIGWQASIVTLPVIFLMYRTYRVYLTRLETERHQAEKLRQNAEAMASLHLRTIESLALAIDAKDHTTQAHLQRVQFYAVEIGKELQLEEAELEALRAASLLHDIGKLAVPEHIVSKPGKLTPEEFEKMKIHPTVGAEILDSVQFPYPVVPIVRHHHEKWDGSGYPCGLKGEEIPIGARILAIVDCLDALLSHRQYRRALSPAEAVAVVGEEAGRSFDPAIVKVLENRYLDLEQKARASDQNASDPNRVRLSGELRVRRGDLAATPPDHRRQKIPSGEQASGNRTAPRDFLASIAAARCEVQTLFDMTQSLGNSLSLEETLSLLATRLLSLVPYDGLALYACRDGYLLPEFVTGEDKDLFSSLQIPHGEGLSGWVAENRLPVINGNPSVESGYLNDPQKFSLMRSALAIPLEGHDRLVGVLTLYRSSKDSFDRDHLRILQAISVKLGASLENGLKYRLANGDASTDYLTGLPNARSLFLHLERECLRCSSQGENLAVLLCDLDGFKAVNDRFGHLEGNRLLRLFAAAVRESCRPEDYVARLGGDEFVIVISGMSPEDEMAATTRFRQIPADIAKASAHLDFLAVSIGCAHLGADGTEPDQLLAESDRRMYKTKRSTSRESVSRAGIAPAFEGEIFPAATTVH